MDAARAVDWTEREGQRTWIEPRPLVRVDEQTRRARLARENVRLADENARLRSQNADLAASAEIWIRLYEAALARIGTRLQG